MNIQDPLIGFLQKVIHFAVRILAVLMTLVILWGVVDVATELYQRLLEPPVMLINIGDLLATFGTFMAVLIAIEIFVNITAYISENVIHIKIVMATALMAVARKVIIFDYNELGWQYVYATAAVILALSIGYWLLVYKSHGQDDVEMVLSGEKDENDDS